MSAIKLATPSSGSISLSPANTASNLTITVPAVTGTMLTTASTFGATGPSFSAWQSSGQTLSSAVTTKINYQTELWDTNSNYDTSTSRFTPTVAGYYQINAAICTASTASQQILAIYKNGSLYQRNDIPSININQISSVVYCNGSTDYIEIYASFGTGQNTFASVNLNWFNGALLRAA